jgi:hypothetical protein
MGQSKTASEYSMSRAQALQRLQTIWKIFTSWWKEIFGKAIPNYIKDLRDDERYVEKDKSGNFINIFIKKSELEGKIGNVELEANENLPITWNQQRDVIMQLLTATNPLIQQWLMNPENLSKLHEAIGLTDFSITGEDDRNKQYEEINQLINSEPITVPPDPMMVMQSQLVGAPPPEEEMQPSVEVDTILDNHAIEFEVCRKWLNSEAGQLAKTDNPRGRQNVLLHAYAHFQLMTPPIPEGEGVTPSENPKENTKTPIQGEEDVNQIQ